MKISKGVSILMLVMGIRGRPALPRRESVSEQPGQTLGFKELEARQIGNAENDITDGSPCKALTIIFARGTTETGNVGTITGTYIWTP